MPVVMLKHPFDLNGKRYEALTLSRAKGGALRMLDRSGALGMMQELGKAVAKAKAGAQAAGLDPEKEENLAVDIPAGLIDKLAPFLATLAGVDEAVIDEVDADDYLALFAKVEECMPGSPLPRRK